MYSGASSVVSSLWKVEDAATAELMKRFYRAMLKENQTPSAALRTAQNEMRQIPRFSNPRHWAGFTLTGEWK
jgi:CHAT domain-containing protein